MNRLRRIREYFFPRIVPPNVSVGEYGELFPDRPARTPTVREAALEHALDIRKFEIELYWKRANYFWTFIAATFAGYAAVQTLEAGSSRTDLSVLLSCLGVVLSFGWFCANRGSKQWQENWENHVDLLEDGVVGPLYKTMLFRPPPTRRLKNFVVGPAHLSVSKINQIISLFVTFLWVVLLWRALPQFSLEASIDWLYVASIAATLLACFLFVSFGRTSEGEHCPVAVKRLTTITPPQLVDEPVGAGEEVEDCPYTI